MKAIKISVLLLFVFLSIHVNAQFTKTWTGGASTDSFTDSDNWMPSGVPSATDTLVFNTGTDINIAEIPDGLSFAGIMVIPNFSIATNVTFSFTTSYSTINFNEFIIEESCSFSNSDFANLNITNAIYLGGATVSINGNINTQVSTIIDAELQNLITAETFLNNGTISLNAGGELRLNCILNNMGTININNGSLIIEKEYLHDMSSSLLGGSNATLIFEENVTHVDVLPNSLTNLSILECYAPISIILTSNLKIWHLLNMVNGILDFTDQTLIVGGDIFCQEGVLAGSGTSALNIDEGGSIAQSNLSFDVAGSKDTLNTLSLNRPDKIIDINSDLIISDNLYLTNGKLRISYGDINIFESASVTVANTNNYIITGESGTVSSLIPIGNLFLLPVGSESYYAPVSINPGAANLFHVSVKDFVYSNGYDGDILAYNDLVNLTWDIQTSAITYDLNLEWAGAEGIGFDLTNDALLNFAENQWINTNMTNTDLVNGISIINLDVAGLFMVSSHQNIVPTGSDKEVTTTVGTDYVFKTDDFPITDTNGDGLVKLMITQTVNDGILYVDYDDSGNFSADEESVLDYEILYSDLSTGKFRYVPSMEGIFDFLFNVSDGLNYSNTDNKMTIVVGTNIILAEDQSFYIPEHSPNGTEVGQIQAGENADIILFEMLAHENADAFDISETGLITVSNSSLLVISDKPEFKYPMVANNASTAETSNFIITIFLKDVIIGDIFVTNYISPNGDGINDTWIVRGKDGGQYNVAVFDKRGNLVFRAENYMNDWQGTNNGTRLSPGVYYYIVRSDSIEEKGTITLIR